MQGDMSRQGLPMIADASMTLDKPLSGCARADSRNDPSAA